MSLYESTGRELSLNGHIIGFRPQTQKLESPYKTPSNTLAVKETNCKAKITLSQTKSF